MGVVVATTAGLVVWIVLWAIGGKAFDAFLITLAVAVVAATVQLSIPRLTGRDRAE